MESKATVSRTRAGQLASHPDFPEPVQRLAMGPVWLEADVQRFLDTPRKPGPRRDRNADSNRERGHQRTTRDKGARDLVLPRWSPLLSTAAQDYGSEGWGFESLRARFSDQRKYYAVTF